MIHSGISMYDSWTGDHEGAAHHAHIASAQAADTVAAAIPYVGVAAAAGDLVNAGGNAVQAGRRLGGASDEETPLMPSFGHKVVDGVLALTLRFFRRVVFFIVREPWVLGWSGAGEGMDRALAASLRIPLDQPSVFRTVSRDKTVFIGRFPVEEENQRFLKALGKRPQSSAVLLPVSLRSRVVNLVYGDNGATDRVRGDLGELMVLLQKVPRAYLRIIRKRVADARALVGEEPEHVERND